MYIRIRQKSNNTFSVTYYWHWWSTTRHGLFATKEGCLKFVEGILTKAEKLHEFTKEECIG